MPFIGGLMPQEIPVGTYVEEGLITFTRLFSDG